MLSFGPGVFLSNPSSHLFFFLLLFPLYLEKRKVKEPDILRCVGNRCLPEDHPDMIEIEAKARGGGGECDDFCASFFLLVCSFG